MHEDVTSDLDHPMSTSPGYHEGGLRRWGGNELLGQDLSDMPRGETNLDDIPGQSENGSTPPEYQQNPYHVAHRGDGAELPEDPKSSNRQKHKHTFAQFANILRKGSGKRETRESSKSKRQSADARLYSETDPGENVLRPSDMYRSPNHPDLSTGSRQREEPGVVGYDPSRARNYRFSYPYGLGEHGVDRPITDDAREMEGYRMSNASLPDAGKTSHGPC